MTRRKLHFRHPECASDNPLCHPSEDDCLTTNRPHEVECVKCQKLLKADSPLQKEMRQLLKQIYANRLTPTEALLRTIRAV